MRSGMKKSLWLAGALWLAGCGGTEAPTAPEDSAVLGESQSALEYDENLHCLVRTSSVRCSSGMNMYSYWSPTMNSWFIDRNVCSRHGGPVICPF
ncbi:lipoprotein [Myxococcus stipitatus DSM 14675]|uniref:Lipoprotein n=1 Tax=Myxococcus stipitatus (strain DSM 14675 / JCM 12634 / Mx s8) TaxID=1278073 RepID=L7U3T7_MYXSD|nr:hypothetical protein [Myxococcus stipitatus]AGC42505.1 lipoprotein [Myxococcus stipitatus DSM 14675]